MSSWIWTRSFRRSEYLLVKFSSFFIYVSIDVQFCPCLYCITFSRVSLIDSSFWNRLFICWDYSKWMLSVSILFMLRVCFSFPNLLLKVDIRCLGDLDIALDFISVNIGGNLIGSLALILMDWLFLSSEWEWLLFVWWNRTRLYL